MLDDKCTLYQASSGGVDALLFQSSADCIKILNLEGDLVELNPGGVAALELDHIRQLDGQRWAALWPDASRPAVEAAVASGAAGERAHFAAFGPTVKGSERWWDVLVSPIRNTDGAVAQLMVVSRDVTDIHLARLALQEANQRKDEFLALLSHELRNPLSAAGMAASVLQTPGLPAAKVADVGRLIERQVAYMSRLAEDLLDVSRVTRGEIVLKTEPVDLKEVVRAALEQLHPLYSGKQQAVTTAMCDEPCIVMGDRTRLVQVVGNVVGNAVRYTPAGGTIALELACDAGLVTLGVHDSGVGIAAEEMASLFDLYKKVGHNDERKGGLGIGLALVRSLLELHAGSVAASSPGKGQGSTFTIALPAARGA